MEEKRERVNLNDVELGSHQHVALTKSLIERIKAFHLILREVDPLESSSSLEESIDYFLRDHNPEREIAVWEKIAERYQKSVEQKPDMTSEQKKELFAKLLLQSTDEDPIKIGKDQ